MFENLIGRTVDSVELFRSSEGFFAYQDQQEDKGLLLLLNNEIFYEFIKADEFWEQKPERFTLDPKISKLLMSVFCNPSFKFIFLIRRL